LLRVNDLRRVGREGRQVTKPCKTATSPEGARRRVDMGGRKIAHPLEGWNVVVGSCPFRETGKGAREKK